MIPPHHELRKRTARRNEEMGLPVPEDAINAMKGESKWSVLAFRVATTSLSIELLYKCVHIQCTCTYRVYIHVILQCYQGQGDVYISIII